MDPDEFKVLHKGVAVVVEVLLMEFKRWPSLSVRNSRTPGSSCGELRPTILLRPELIARRPCLVI